MNMIENYLTESIEKPQRHRLLHGYPYPNLMRSVNGSDQPGYLFDNLTIAHNKPVIIGVLPHTSCNPLIKGCGFCTFPHQSWNTERVRETVGNVSEEIKSFNKKHNAFRHAKVQSIYFGGGTANLTPKDLFENLCQDLCNSFDCSDAEVTLEGVPKYFTLDNFRYLDILQRNFNAGKLRLSIGIQTFDEVLLHQMGRQKFGDKNCIRMLAKEAQTRGVGLSGDLLFNLPGQTIEMMKSDIFELYDLGFNQVSIYHLVMFRGLGPEWSKDPSILSSLPDNKTALENWLKLREMLLSLGYEQRTLTNFQKKSEGHNFEYEECVFQPENFNWIGFGPSAISTFYDDNFNKGIKLLNPETASKYNENSSPEKYFLFDEMDMKVLFVTRKIALLEIDKVLYNKLFNSNIELDFAEEIYSLSKAKLISNLKDKIELTPMGMFFADTVAGVFSLRKAGARRRFNLRQDHLFFSENSNDGVDYPMG